MGFPPQVQNLQALVNPTQCYVQRSYVNLGSETTLAVHYLTSPELDFRYLRAAAPTPHPATNDVQVLKGPASLTPRPTQPPVGQQQNSACYSGT